MVKICHYLFFVIKYYLTLKKINEKGCFIIYLFNIAPSFSK